MLMLWQLAEITSYMNFSKNVTAYRLNQFCQKYV